MKFIYSAIFPMLFMFFGINLQAQKKKPFQKADFVPVIRYCPVSFEYHDHYVPRRKTARRKNSATQFNVTYNGAINAVARRAFEEGVLSIVTELFDTPIPINIELDWEQLEGGTLAGASPTAYYSNFPNVPNPDQVYPVALAEKITRLNINDPEEADIFISVNQDANWFFDYDNPGGIGNQFDFVSVLLHEVMHGLGFTSLAGVSDEGLGFVRTFNNDRYSIYSDFLFNIGNGKITDVTDGTTMMAGELQSNNLFFNLISSNRRAKVYAPLTYDPGSSISHVDELTYNNTSSSLMTPSTSPGEIELDPGIATEMMYDMGWDMTYMIHFPQPGKEDLDQEQLLQVEVISDSEFNDSTLVMHYSTDNFVAVDTILPLQLNQSTGLYEATLPAPNEEKVYNYYFTVDNARNITFTNPGRAPDNSFEYRYQLDNQIPIVNHISPGEINDVDPTFVVEAKITDFYLGVDTALINWTVNDLPQESILMMKQEGFSEGDETDNYKGTMVFPGGPPVEGDEIKYNIVAIDKSKAKNTALAPFSGNWTLNVVPVEEAVTSYNNDFNLSTDDFSGRGFTIRSLTGFSDEAIHSTHPYPEAGQGNFQNFTYELKFPIEIQEEDPLIEFDEIVIVEEGEPGTVFGEDEFWDYVIVEGKVVGESEWKPFLDGYDSRVNSIWLNAYRNGGAINSSFFRPRTINMTQRGRFIAGEQVFIRFRLFSDPFANGWGWAIDNLRIQDKSTAVEDFIVEENFRIFPNPVDQNEVTIALDLENSSDLLEIRIYDIFGRLLSSLPLQNKSKRIRQNIDLSQMSSGIYFINVAFNDRDMISKKLIRN